MARRKFWMIDALMPKSPDGKTLKQAIDFSFENDRKILDIGCGDKAQALVDLKNDGYDNLYGLDIKPPKEIKGIDIKKESIIETSYPDNYFDGVVFSAYVLAHLSPQEQLLALQEIDRITGSGAYGFIGPFSVYSLYNTPFAEVFSGYKNPLLGYVDFKNSEKKGHWQLHKTFLTNFGVYSKPSKLNEVYYRSPIPLYMAYVLSGRSIMNKFIPSRVINKDYKEKLPLEYYITFKKD